MSPNQTAGHCPGCLLQLGLALEPRQLELDAPVASMPGPAKELADEHLGQTIERFRILRRIGEGGSGVVYLAEQEEPMRRLVALKLIKLGMDTQEVISRFEAERQALALMNHPHIAQVLDAGATTQGRPYFVMELVPGMKITDFAQQQDLTVRERLELFELVCGAVQHAHQKGIVHRDLKPSNILVTHQDGIAIPKVIDFGIAKATQGRLSSNTLYTAFEQFMGTPAYMSPEQVELRSCDVDTRTDIYSLGVLLYELLTGTTPFNAHELLERGFDEMRRTILFRHPLPPSARLNLSRGPGGQKRARRQFRFRAPARDAHQRPKRDLDWIVLKCLEKDRTRRYPTANDLNQDVQRYLNQEPVVARPPSRLYSLGKLVQRNKVPFAAAAVLFLVLAMQVIISTLQAIRAREAEARADENFVLATAESRRAHEHETKAQAESESAKRQQHRADAAAVEALQNLYAARMNVAQLAWEQNKVTRVRQILDETASDPQRGFEWFYWQRQTHLEQRTFRGHVGALGGACFAPDGATIVTASGDKTAIVWDALTGVQRRILRGHAQRIWSVSSSPDGRWLVTASADQTARVWDLLSGQQLLILKGHTDEVRSAVFSPDGQLIATCSADCTVKLWDASSGRERLTLSGHSSRVWSAAFSPDGRRLVTVSADRSARVWDVQSGRELQRFVKHTDGVRSVAVSPDGQHVVSAGWDRQVKLWEINSGKELRSFHGHSAPVWCVAFSPDGQRVASGSADQTVRIWEPESGRELAALRGHLASINAVAFSPRGDRIVTASDDHTAKIWNVLDPEQQSTLRGHAEGVASLAFSPDGRSLLTGSLDSTARLWDLSTATEQLSFAGHDARIWMVAFSPSGTLFATGSEDATIKIWNVQERLEQFTLCGHTALVGSLAFSPDGNSLISGSADGTIRVWDLTNRTERIKLNAHTGRVWAVAVSPDGRLIATAGEDRTAKLWAADTGAELMTFSGHLNRVRSVAFSNDGCQLATGSGDWTAKIWDLTSGKAIRTFKGHGDGVAAVAFSPDGRRLLTGSEDQTAKLWDATSGQELLTFNVHGARVRTVSFSPDGLSLATGSDDQLVKLWRAASPGQIQTWTEQERAGQTVLSPDPEDHASSLASAATRAQPPEPATQWLVLAPIPYAGHSGAVPLDQEIVSREGLLRPREGESVHLAEGPELTWRKLHVPDGLLDINRFLGAVQSWNLAYAVAYFQSADAQRDIALHVGSDDQAKIYLNGRLVYRRAGSRTYTRDQDVVAGLELNPGLNVLVVKTINETGSWKASVELSRADGQPLTGIRFLAESP